MKPWTLNPLLDAIRGTTPAVEWIFRDFLAQGTLFALAGLAGTGKSFLCYTLGIALAAGVSVLGFEPERGPLKVLYFDDENSGIDYTGYQRQIWQGLELTEVHEETVCTNFWAQHFELGQQGWETIAAEYIMDFKPHIFFIDTATPSLNIDDENDNGEASRAIQRLRHLMELPRSHIATCVVLKHAKELEHRGETYTMRGAKAWHGQVDGFGYLVRARGRTPKTGWGNTILVPGKTRAYGLREEIHIHPEPVGLEGGYRLTRQL